MYAQLLHWFGFGLCHQLPERSFFGGGVQVPVCARDTGIYAGVVLSILIIAALQKRPAEFPSIGVAVLLGAFVLAMAIDGVTEYAGLRGTTNLIRLITGLLCGYAMGALIAPLINEQLWRTSSAERVLGTTRSLVLWLASIPVAFALLWFGGTILGALYPLVIAICVLVALTEVNLIIVTLFPSFERKADRLAEAWKPILAAFCISLFEIAAAAVLKLWLVVWLE